MSGYVTPESDFTRVHRIGSTNGPFGKRTDETEYTVTIDGRPAGAKSWEDVRNILTFTDYREACEWANDLELDPTLKGRLGIVHRRVIRESWFTTTREA